MALSPLHEFIDEEMLRAPMTFDQVVDTVHEHWRVLRGGAGFGRDASDPARVLQHSRHELVATALSTLREAVQADLALVGRTAAPGATPALPPARSAGLALSLIDEDDVAADIEVARCTETVRLRAEAELRELQTFTSALVGDPNVSRDTNPFRPELMVRALWQGVQGLPLSRASQAAFMRESAEPLAKALKQAYAGATARLEDRGVTPAAHRTIVVTGGTYYGSKAPRYRPPAMDLQAVRHSLHGLLDPLGVPPAHAGDAPGADAQLILLLTRLFDEIQADRALSPELAALVMRLQPAAMRVALAEPAMLDSYEHPVWRFLDGLAHAVSLTPPADRLRMLGMGRNLVDHLVAGETDDGQRFEWALGRLQAMGRHSLTQALTAATPQIERLRRQAAAASATTTTGSMPLDVGTLDTVPAALLQEPGPAADAAPPTEPALQPGQHLRAWLQGDWRVLMLLWRDDEDTLWVLREPATERLWAVRPAAIQRLLAEQLAQRLDVRSLVRRAAERVLRAL